MIRLCPEQILKHSPFCYQMSNVETRPLFLTQGKSEINEKQNVSHNSEYLFAEGNFFLYHKDVLLTKKDITG